jgi:hypothetical protein
VPGDVLAEDDRYWGGDPTSSPAEAEAIEQVHECRRLAQGLAAARDAPELPRNTMGR